ncbi:MAG: FtsX-like permease family protein [Acidobacteria bacterium]|nr:FtsX-like permease family protein [Acidobacteriota bacterium]
MLAFINSMGNVKVFLLAICAAVTFTVLLVSANTMAMSVRERVREVGILKTLGFRSEIILGMILGEAAMVSAIGGVLGLTLAAALCSAVRRAPIPYMTQLKSMTIAPPVALGCLAVAVAIGLASSLIPAWSAARTPIIQALRQTD